MCWGGGSLGEKHLCSQASCASKNDPRFFPTPSRPSHRAPSPRRAPSPTPTPKQTTSPAPPPPSPASASSPPPRPLDACRALVLDAAHRPIDVVPWTRAVVLELACGGGGDARASVEILSYFDGVVVRSASATHRVPAVLRSRVLAPQPGATRRRGSGQNQPRPLPPASRRNVLARDGGRCVYCGARGEPLTIDHVIPLSRGGPKTIDNCVAACVRCNGRKGSRTLAELGWRVPRGAGRAPTRAELLAARVGGAAGAPPEWRDWFPASVFAVAEEEREAA